MLSLDMERRIHETTDIDLRPHLANLSEDLGMPSIASELRDNPEIDIEKAIDFIEEAVFVYNQAQ